MKNFHINIPHQNSLKTMTLPGNICLRILYYVMPGNVRCNAQAMLSHKHPLPYIDVYNREQRHHVINPDKHIRLPGLFTLHLVIKVLSCVFGIKTHFVNTMHKQFCPSDLLLVLCSTWNVWVVWGAKVELISKTKLAIRFL